MLVVVAIMVQSLFGKLQTANFICQGRCKEHDVATNHFAPDDQVLAWLASRPSAGCRGRFFRDGGKAQR
jgi:hypothetical protein